MIPPHTLLDILLGHYPALELIEMIQEREADAVKPKREFRAKHAAKAAREECDDVPSISRERAQRILRKMKVG